MAFPVFTPPYPPRRNGRVEPKLMINRVQFGDGYTQRSAQGINSVQDSVSLSWEALSDAQADAMMNFLRAMGGVQAFLYQLPWESTPKLWTCEKFTRTRDERRFDNMDVTFDQAFDPV